jgi:hypothetical protein
VPDAAPPRRARHRQHDAGGPGPDLRKALIAKWRTGVIAEVEMTMDIPEYANMNARCAAG